MLDEACCEGRMFSSLVGGSKSNDVKKASDVLLLAKGMRMQIGKALEASKENLERKKNYMVLVEKAQVFLQKVAQETQSQLKFRIEDIVNMALETCFPNEYEFKLDFNVMRGKTDCSLVFLSKRTGREIDPMNASGGGVVDVVCFALRTACYVLEQGIDNVIVLDEPMKFVSQNLRSRVCEVIRNLSDRLGLQFIIVTHIDEFIDIADTIFEVKKGDDGRSIVKKR